MVIFDVLWAYASVFLLAAVPCLEVRGIIPMGILAGLSTVPVTILALLGNLLTVLLVIIFVDHIRQWRKSRRGEDNKDGKGALPGKHLLRAKKIWQRYGLPGLAVIGPLVVGSHITAYLSVSLGGAKIATVYMTISLVAWSAVVALLAHLGVGFVFDITGQEGFLLRYLRGVRPPCEGV